MNERTEHSAAPGMAACNEHCCQVLNALQSVPHPSLLDLCVPYGSHWLYVVVEYLSWQTGYSQLRCAVNVRYVTEYEDSA